MSPETKPTPLILTMWYVDDTILHPVTKATETSIILVS